MKTERLVQHLSEAVRRLGFKLRIEEGNFRGGSCVFGPDRLLILNRRMSQEERAELLARVLAREDVDALFLMPEVRRYVESFVTTESLPESSAAGRNHDAAPVN